jgi:hypothetical protein
VKFKDIQLWMMIAVLVLAPLFFGQVDLFWIAAWSILLPASALRGIATAFAAQLNSVDYCRCSGSMRLHGLTAADVFQRWNDLIRRRASELLGTALVPRISLRGEIPPLPAALPAFCDVFQRN